MATDEGPYFAYVSSLARCHQGDGEKEQDAIANVWSIECTRNELHRTKLNGRRDRKCCTTRLCCSKPEANQEGVVPDAYDGQ